MAHQVINGAFTAEAASEERHVIGDLAVLTVRPDGRTACRVDNGVKWPGGRKVSIFVGEIDGVRAYVHERGGRIHVILTRGEIKP